MKSLGRHLSRCLVAGVVAILPIGGLILLVAYIENSISESWLARQPFYFPGFGLIVAIAIIYAIGLTVSTVIGQWIWSRVDRLLHHLPALGWLYRSLKEILGYGQGEDAVFRQVVLIRCRELPGDELGLVTNSVRDASGAEQLVVFVPGAPNPTVGRLLLVDPAEVRPLPMSVNDALKTLVSLGKTSLQVTPEAAQ